MTDAFHDYCELVQTHMILKGYRVSLPQIKKLIRNNISCETELPEHEAQANWIIKLEDNGLINWSVGTIHKASPPDYQEDYHRLKEFLTEQYAMSPDQCPIEFAIERLTYYLTREKCQKWVNLDREVKINMDGL